jgi:hypothetical protein
VGVGYAGDLELGSVISNHVCFHVDSAWGDDGKELGNSFNCKKLLTQSASFVIELGKEEATNSHTPAHQDAAKERLGTYFKAAQNVELTQKESMAF